MQHVTFDIDLVDDDFLSDGTMFDGSSISGWKAINESRHEAAAGPRTAPTSIPFYQQTTLCLFCDVLNPDTNEPYNRDPRSIAKKALLHVQGRSVSATRCFSVRKPSSSYSTTCKWSTSAHDTRYSYDSIELPVNTGKAYEEGNMGLPTRDPRAATSRSTRWTLRRTCAARCWR